MLLDVALSHKSNKVDQDIDWEFIKANYANV